MSRLEDHRAQMLERALTDRQPLPPSADRQELDTLLALADELHRELNPPPASSTVQARLETRLMNRLRGESRRTTPRLRSIPLAFWFRRAVVVVLVVGLLAGLTGGTALAASQALPGEVFYPLKLAEESLQLAFSPSAEKDAALLLRITDARLTETSRLLTRGQEDLAARTLERYDSSLVDLMLAVSRLRDGSSLARTRLALGRQRKAVIALSADAPPAVLPGLERAALHTGQAEATLSSLEESPRSEPGTPPESASPKHTPPGQEAKATKQSGEGGGKEHGRKNKQSATPAPRAP